MSKTEKVLPNLNCGSCGFATCHEFHHQMEKQPDLISRCIHLTQSLSAEKEGESNNCLENNGLEMKDSLGREFDFYLEHFPHDPGPREIILPHNPMITREMNISKGDVLIGRPLGMSCGCPVTHCGVVIDVDPRIGVIVWCVTGPLRPRQQGFKDLGYYIAEGYEGLVRVSKFKLEIGRRYFFQPRMCMLQWRHSGLVNFLNQWPDKSWQVRLEGLWIG